MTFEHNIPEEQLKNEVAETVFFAYDCTRIIGNIDFCIAPHAPKGAEKETLASHTWAEAKRGKGDLDEALVQLLLTIGKARTFDKYNPPKYLAAFNAEGIVFVEYSAIHQVFYQNDFNWNVAPNDHGTKEFRQLAGLVGETLGNNALRFGWHSPTLKRFISLNFNTAQTTALLQIDKNNFISVYSRWLDAVKPSIAVDWDKLRRAGIIDGDFYLADIMSQDNRTITEKLYVLLQNDRYVLNRQIDDSGLYNSSSAIFKDGQKSHADFWRKYQRPPESVYWDYILDRRDLLVPQDIRERKGSFFTPRQWVELSQQYLADYLGRDWQDEYHIWDCAAGTGNLLAGLTNPSRVWASTLDQQDVDVMHQRIENGAALFKNHVFQFDFLNDSFDKLPEELREVVTSKSKRRKLLIYINPPYAEAGGVMVGRGRRNKTGVSNQTKVYDEYVARVGMGIRELFAQFFLRVHGELSGCRLAAFSKLKFISGDAFTAFRGEFSGAFLGGFLVPAATFDNVKGQFPIAFSIWNLNSKKTIAECAFQRYEDSKQPLGEKLVTPTLRGQRITQWITQYNHIPPRECIGYTGNSGPDFQHNRYLRISTLQGRNSNGTLNNATKYGIAATNLIPMAVYLAVRLAIPMSWDNDRDQYLFPNTGWEGDAEFQSDCLAYALLHGQNRVRAEEGTNHWIPFTEQELGMAEGYKSHFMVDFLHGKLKPSPRAKQLFNAETPAFPTGQTPITFSTEAQALLEAGRELFRYYHQQPKANPNASLYDIRRHFQRENEKGEMNPTSPDEEYMRLIGAVREARKHLGDTKIAPKVYAYGFLLE